MKKILASVGDDTIDLAEMTNEELLILNTQLTDLQAEIFKEIGRWEVIRCAVCDRDDLSYRSEPWIGWLKIDGHVLCPLHAMRWKYQFKEDLHDIGITPKDKVLSMLD